MATREAGIRLTLNAGSFVTTMEQMANESKKTGTKIRSNLADGFKGVGSAGLKGASDSLKSMAGGLRDSVGMAATLGGGVGFGMLVKKASDLRSQVRDIEFAINKTGTQTANWKDLLGGVQTAADATGKTSQDMADALAFLFTEGGDAEFAQKALIPIGHAATASGKSLAQMATIANMLQEKFGATFETLPEMLAVVTQKTGVGGAGLEAMGDKFGLLAGEAVDAGFAGTEGLASVLGMIGALDDRLGEKSIPSFKKLFQTLKDGSSSLKEISKASGLKLGGLDGEDKLRKIMGSDKARKALTEKLGGEQRVVFDLLSKPFVEAAAEAKKNGAKGKEATAAGLAAFDAAMSGMSNSTLKFQNLLAQSQAKQADDPQIKLNKAIEKISQKFTEPKMLESLDKLSDSLPKVANGMIKILDFAVNSPVLAGGAFIGGKVALAAGGSMASKGMENVAGMMKGALVSGGKSVAEDIKGQLAQGAPGWGKMAGATLGVAAGALIAFEIGKSIIDARIDEKAKSQKASIGADIEATNAMNAKDPAAMAEAKAKLEADLVRQREDYNSFTKSGLDPIMNFGAKLVDSDFKPPEMTQMENTQKAIADLTAAMTALSEKTNAAAKGTDDLATGAKKAGQAAQQASSQLSGIAGAPVDTTGAGVSKGPGGPGNRATPGFAAGG